MSSLLSTTCMLRFHNHSPTTVISLLIFFFGGEGPKLIVSLCATVNHPIEVPYGQMMSNKGQFHGLPSFLVPRWFCATWPSQGSRSLDCLGPVPRVAPHRSPKTMRLDCLQGEGGLRTVPRNDRKIMDSSIYSAGDSFLNKRTWMTITSYKLETHKRTIFPTTPRKTACQSFLPLPPTPLESRLLCKPGNSL